MAKQPGCFAVQQSCAAKSFLAFRHPIIIMKRENKAILEMLLCAALWSIAGIFIKLLPWSGFTVSSLRSLIAGLTILYSL